MMKFEYYINLHNGYRPVMQSEEETSMTITLEARNRATADRMIKALIKVAGNVKEYSEICIEQESGE